MLEQGEFIVRKQVIKLLKEEYPDTDWALSGRIRITPEELMEEQIEKLRQQMAEKLLLKLSDENIEVLRAKGIDLTSREAIMNGLDEMLGEQPRSLCSGLIINRRRNRLSMLHTHTR